MKQFHRPLATGFPAATLIIENDASAGTVAFLERAGLEVETISAGEGMQALLRRRPALAIIDLDDASSRTTALLAEAALHPQLGDMVVLGIGSRSSSPRFSELRRLICLVVERGDPRRLHDLVLLLQGS